MQHPRQFSGSKDRHHRDHGSSDDRQRRQDIGIIVDAVDPVIGILVSAANLRIDFAMITPTTDIATSRDP
jgi:hypothetical protein